ncbi:restriction endonuclease subunit S [Streptococcus mutans]|uniref:restriction endonuclease subunit S n=1 Tax=Streptococcus mutans TaxID=1309 RepID=UPI0002B5C0DF|nr:restriction endonuclease subunit S [Streptococcus mutans]EMC49357.1 putative type I restriction enzyme specificity protein [Streptococcus mutans SA41]MDP5872915.1 restriction endonuclease subunit S [Streptococcus mutans]
MKDSGVEWIGEIPESWEVARFKDIANLYTGNSISSDDKSKYIINKGNTYPYVATKDILLGSNTVDYSDVLYIPSENTTFKIAVADSVLMCVEGGSAGKKKTYLTQTVTFVNKLCCFAPTNIEGKYLFYILSSKGFEEEFNKYLSGLISGVSISILKNVYLTYPKDKFQQQKIVDILDDKIGRIDQIISETQQSIEELKKYKQSVITEAVTKGLDKKAKMKDSGIEWIGEVPSDSKIVRIKNYFTLKGRIGWQGLTSAEYIDEGPYLITGVDFANGEIDWNKSVHISEKRYEEAPEIHIKEGDLLITKDGTIGKVAITKNTPQKVSLNSGVMLIREKLNNGLNKKFMYYILLSDIFWKWFNLSNIGASTINHLYQGQFYNFSFPLMTIEKQNEIVLYLDYKTKIIDSLISTKEQIINSYEQYKKSLIYEYVTGKKEVE